jgi:aryl-alcohol dehydrogenase-like predicted oxidoreductase
MGMSDGYYGNTTSVQSQTTIRLAYDAGIRFFDTADIYGNGNNESLLGEALRGGIREKIILATKFGLVEDKNNPQKRFINGKKEYVLSACEASLKRLKTDYIDLLYLHRVDPEVKIEETVSAMSELVRRGMVRHLGLSEVSPSILRRAHSIHPITAVQMEFSLLTQAPAEKIIPACEDLGVGLVAYSPLGRGLLTGTLQNAEQFEKQDKRRAMPRFMGENFKQNIMLIAKLEQFAKSKAITLPQLALAWLLHQKNYIVPIFGAKKEKNLLSNIEAEKIKLTKQEIEEIQKIIEFHGGIKGDRYSPEAMSRLDLGC